MEKLIQSVRVYTGKLINMNVDRIELPSGRRTFREYVIHRGAVAAVPLIEREVIFVKQYRYPVKEELLEIPAGTMEKGESPDETMRRELEEEIGYRPDKLVELTNFFSTPGYTTEVIHLYLARGLVPNKKKADDDEYITVKRIPFEDALKMVLNGEIKDGKTIIALLILANRTSLLT